MVADADVDAGGVAGEPRLLVQRVYVKDLSFETPHSPDIFSDIGKLSAEYSCDAKAHLLEDTLYEVVLTITVTSRRGSRTAYIAEVKQAGAFRLLGFSEEEAGRVLRCTCPSILFPYGRELISDLVRRASFPQFNLAHIDFENWYKRRVETDEQPETM